MYSVLKMIKEMCVKREWKNEGEGKPNICCHKCPFQSILNRPGYFPEPLCFFSVAPEYWDLRKIKGLKVSTSPNKSSQQL